MGRTQKVMSYLLFLFTTLNYAQQIAQHTWKERVLIILTHDKENTIYKQQLAEINRDTQGLNERKLIAYSVTPKAYATGLFDLQWIENTTCYSRYKKTKDPFEILLIGLDGGIKLRKTTLLTLKDLYGLIDAMPMRKEALKRN